MDTPPPSAPSWLAEIKESMTWVLGTVAAAFLGYYKLNKVAASDHKSSASDNATTGVIQMLREEVNRLAEQNTLLAENVNQMQREIIELRNENAQLRFSLEAMKNGKQDNQAAS